MFRTFPMFRTFRTRKLFRYNTGPAWKVPNECQNGPNFCLDAAAWSIRFSSMLVTGSRHVLTRFCVTFLWSRQILTRSCQILLWSCHVRSWHDHVRSSHLNCFFQALDSGNSVMELAEFCVMKWCQDSRLEPLPDHAQWPG